MFAFFLELTCGVDMETSRTCTGNNNIFTATGNNNIFTATVCSLLCWCDINECNVDKCNMNERALLLSSS